MKAQLLVQMKALLARLKALEEHSALSPRLLEQPFTFRMDLEEEDVQLCMSGVIDRIDAAAHMGVILDYKSSRKTLSETKVYSGRQLQLPVYALALHSGMIPESEDILDVMGVFYLSTKQESITQEALEDLPGKEDMRPRGRRGRAGTAGQGAPAQRVDLLDKHQRLR